MDAMFPLTEILLLTCFCAIAWFWWDSMQAREAAVNAAHSACATEGVLFLDDTVGITHIKPARNAAGRLQLQRAYDFEFTDTGDNRIKGGIVMIGCRVMLLNLTQRVATENTTLH